MHPPIVALDVTFQFAVFLDRCCSINELVPLDQAEVVLTEHHVMDLLTQRLGKSHIDLGRAHNMLTLLTLLREFRHFLDRDILTFQGVKLQMNLVN